MGGKRDHPRGVRDVAAILAEVDAMTWLLDIPRHFLGDYLYILERSGAINFPRPIIEWLRR